MANASQIKLMQTAARAVKLRETGHYYLLLGQYHQSDGTPAASCKDLNQAQITDFLAICESLGWRLPGFADDHFRAASSRQNDCASIAQQAAIIHLAENLGWHPDVQLAGMIRRMTFHEKFNVSQLDPREAHKLIEALKSMFERASGQKYASLEEMAAAVAPVPEAALPF